MKYQRFKYFGLLTILVEYAAIAYMILVTRQPLSLARTISDYGALDATRFVFGVAFTLAGLCAGLFGLWVADELSLHWNFLISLFIAVAAQATLSWLPDSGSTRPIHYAAAIVVMIAMPIMVHYFSLANKSPLVRLLARWIFWSEILAIVILPITLRYNVPLIAEILSGVTFQLWAVLATFEKMPRH